MNDITAQRCANLTICINEKTLYYTPMHEFLYRCILMQSNKNGVPYMYHISNFNDVCSINEHIQSIVD